MAWRAGGATLNATWARVIWPLIGTIGRTEKGPSVIAALALAAHDALRCQTGRRQGGWCRPRAFVQFQPLLALGHCTWGGQHLGATQVGGAQDVRVAGRPAAVRKVIAAGCRHGVGLMLVAVNLGDIHRVVDVDIGGVVHAADIARTDPIGRPKDFARCQREPAQGRPGCVARADGKVPVVSAHKGDQRRRVHRARRQVPRHPGPARADLCPASVMKRRKSPRCIVHPGPAPG